jgi:hypothetical protein
MLAKKGAAARSMNQRDSAMRRTIGGRPVVHRGGDEIVVKRGAGDRSSLVEEGGSIHARPTELPLGFLACLPFPGVFERPLLSEKKKRGVVLILERSRYLPDLESFMRRVVFRIWWS